MLSEHYELIEALATNFAIAVLFLLIGLAIQDVLNKGNVPKYGRWFVWLVLFLGCAGFIAKGIIQAFWEAGM
ncbi:MULTISPECIES: DUF2788 domain-containing protein [Pseudidiomarina]|uniref:Uncharacterized protein DUF2788 n=3 Tax=Pseudidiomarina TaxID=2800384 RepID=A0A368UZL8_9GAMM|nr:MULTISPECIES: DUF2788 domain-containing protein [Pseudidiomarina]MDX1525313.1 DUF2788 domain-containing protein [Pseudidiomarina maritima]PWW14422.1 uncharacterized protein DUF2788 [Pseudidiomarina maritima]RBP92578.1 uncharacterized protein DUF2788 [Pseudidiomarina tainanensis]RCW34387.1 uncharacterized protein DUF2788 [Pseudidiomarina tainanensis]